MYPELARLVRSGSHDAASFRLSTNYDRLTKQGRIKNLLDRDKKGVQVDMENRAQSSFSGVTHLEHLPRMCLNAAEPVDAVSKFKCGFAGRLCITGSLGRVKHLASCHDNCHFLSGIDTVPYG
jgi:hypothetical protein